MLPQPQTCTGISGPVTALALRGILSSRSVWLYHRELFKPSPVAIVDSSNSILSVVDSFVLVVWVY